jgi:hypothetical protein
MADALQKASRTSSNTRWWKNVPGRTHPPEVVDRFSQVQLMKFFLIARMPGDNGVIGWMQQLVSSPAAVACPAWI